MKVCVIDDDPNILEALVEALSQMGFDPIPFSCPKLALSVLTKSDVYLVLVDYTMPAMSGTEFVTEMKKARPSVECILMTANGYREVLIDAMRAGAADLIRKPFDLITIEDSLKRSIARLQLIPTLAEMENKLIMKALAVCETDKDAAARLGINYTTLYRKKKAIA